MRPQRFNNYNKSFDVTHTSLERTFVICPLHRKTCHDLWIKLLRSLTKGEEWKWRRCGSVDLWSICWSKIVNFFIVIMESFLICLSTNVWSLSWNFPQKLLNFSLSWSSLMHTHNLLIPSDTYNLTQETHLHLHKDLKLKSWVNCNKLRSSSHNEVLVAVSSRSPFFLSRVDNHSGFTSLIPAIEWNLCIFYPPVSLASLFVTWFLTFTKHLCRFHRWLSKANFSIRDIALMCVILMLFLVCSSWGMGKLHN